MPGGATRTRTGRTALSVFPSPQRAAARPSGRGAELTAGGQLRNGQ